MTKTFNTQTLSVNVQFGSKSGSATLARLMSTLSSLCPGFPDSNTRPKFAIWVSIWMRRDPWRIFVLVQDFSSLGAMCNLGPRFLSRLSELMTRLSRLKLSARLCNLGLNPNAALLSRLSRTYVQTFQTRTVGANLQFGSKSGCVATLGATHVRLPRPYV